ncbi:hypothetical protein LAZ67_5002290 [Cordylochernes scorpioides]|uniref:Integrase catalytic domain-containing protein n=1 Tax=Cordylochernes scorpioides TaxID=51811 RepID=A0ABY6KGA6_9ARAC|nr:hypothetical protein LAZ67_5002290 [Cordylochernes scorpioides]
MDAIEYNNKIEQLLQDKDIYEPLTKNPLTNLTKDFNRQFNKIKRKYKLDNKTFDSLKATAQNLPNLHGLPKVHKPNTPLRPIVSYSGSPLYTITKFLSSIISPFQKKLLHTVPNPIVAIEAIKNTPVSPGSRIISFDIESLYTSIPHDEAILALQEFINSHPDLPLPIPKEALIELIKLCLSFNYFFYKNRYFKQVKGLPMGNPISSALANVFMDKIDKLIVESTQLQILMWKRYIDDVLCITEVDVSIIINFLNSLRPFLKFTYELEENGSLPFLDLQLTRNQNKIETKIHRKPTHTGSYLNFNSFGPICHKVAVVKTLSKSGQRTMDEDGEHYVDASEVPATFIRPSLANLVNRLTEALQEVTASRAMPLWHLTTGLIWRKTFSGNSLKRFISRRGKPSDIFSDNGTNFRGANNILREQFGILKASTIQKFISNERINWHFIPPSAPNFGGVWEAGIKSFKFHLLRCLKSQILTFEELSTLTTQIEACLNSRPICPLSSDSDDFNPLTPGHFLIGRPLTAPPESNDDDDVPINHLDRWSLNQKIKNVFWKRWNRKYLNNLQRLKWQKSSPNIKEGDLILLKNIISPPAMYWSLGRITKVFPGADGKVRVVEVKTKHQERLTRTVSKIVPLPFAEN